jgi:hypothetical protein
MIGCLVAWFVLLLNIQLGRHRQRKEDSIEMDHEEIGSMWSGFI